MEAKMTDYRIEKDTMGEVKVPADRLWGAQTQRSLENFEIGEEKMPKSIIAAFAILKCSAAEANAELDVLEADKAEKISQACDEILSGKYADEFPLSVWQTGSGTQTNMNVNEVIAHLTGLHPNDDVNRGQSSNDTFPTALHIALAIEITESLIPAIFTLQNTFDKLADEYADVVKIGRTHLMDATPLTLGQEISAWSAMLDRSYWSITTIVDNGGLLELALGGTAVGTGLNTHPDFGMLAAQKIGDMTGIPFVTAPNKFEALTSRNAVTLLHGALKALAADLMKIANDIRLLASGPRCGVGELIIPENEPGSSIMPGKVNPTQCEALSMVCARVIGNDVTVGLAASQGHLQLNVYLPVIAYTALQSIRLLEDAIISFDKNCARGIRPNEAVIEKHLNESLMLVTALTPKIGYEKAAEIAKKAYAEGITLRESALSLEYLTESEFDELSNPRNMV
jgi:fumarate hydratase class II